MSAAFRSIAGLSVALALMSAPATAFAATYDVPLADFGYPQAVQEDGSDGVLALYVPVRPNLQRLHLHVTVAIAPQVDRRSTIEILADNVPIRSATVAAAGLTPTFDVDVPIPARPATSVTISIAGHLFVTGDICARVPDHLWFTVLRGASVSMTTSAPTGGEAVSALLAGYGGAYSVVERGTSPEIRTTGLQLAYRLHQLQHWRRVRVERDGRLPGQTTIVIGAFPHDVAVRGDELDVTPHGAAVIDAGIAGALIAPSIDQTAYAGDTNTPHELSLAGLGIPSRTLRGTGELPFDLPVTYGAFGGKPEHLRLHVALSHTPLDIGDRAFVQVLVNGTLIGSYDMRRDGAPEGYDVPLDVQALSAATIVRIVPTFFPQADACHGNFPVFTTTLLPATGFAWDGVGSGNLTVGDFTRAMSGKVVVLVDDPRNDGAAFRLLSLLGTVNSAVRSIDVQPLGASVPSGYDYAVIVAAPERLTGFGLPLRIDAGTFSIVAPDGTTSEYRAANSAPFGALETARLGGTPALIATYWQNADAFGGMARLSPDEVAAQTGNVLMFDRTETTYASVTPPAVTALNPVAHVMPWLFAAFGVLALGVVAVASRRKV